MTTEEKAKAYDEALEIAKKNYDTAQDLCNGSQIGVECFKNTLTNIFPELRESEDERIRGAIIDHLKDNNLTEWAAWLEKQGEQEEPQVYKTEDGEIITYSESEGYKVIEPKFKVGDWIVDEHWHMHIVKKVSKIDEDGYSFNNGDFASFECANEYFYLWTIQDAKDGDILTNGEIILIFKQFEEPAYRQHIIAYIGLDISGNIQVTDDYWQLGVDKVSPATKEQRELLFKKMNEARYAFDFDKKELKKIEKKTACSDEDDKIRKTLIEFVKGYSAFINGQWRLGDFTTNELIAWLERQGEFDANIITRDDEMLQALSIGLSDVTEKLGWNNFGGLPIEEIHAWLEKQGEQKPIL